MGPRCRSLPSGLNEKLDNKISSVSTGRWVRLLRGCDGHGLRPSFCAQGLKIRLSKIKKYMGKGCGYGR